MKNRNIQAFILAVALLSFTYDYYMTEHGSFMSIGVVVIVGIGALIAFFAYFLGIKMIGYLIYNKIFPNVILGILLPFAVISLLFWLVYGNLYIKPFELTNDYVLFFTGFLSKHLLFIAICTVAIGLTFYFTAPKDRVVNPSLFRNNLLFLLGTFLIFMLSIFAFYRTNLIGQPKLDPKYALYKKLGEPIDSKIYEVEHLVISKQGNQVDKPYLLIGKNELILVAVYGSSNTFPPVESIYRIDKDGKIIESTDDAELTDDNFNTLLLKDGILTDDAGKEEITWIFDHNKKRQSAARIRPGNWNIKMLDKSPDGLHMVYFNKTNALECNKSWQVKYNGTKYYELIQPKEMIKFKLDSIFPSDDPNMPCSEEKKLEYYAPDQLNFSLLRLNEQEYYIIRPKK